MRQLRKGFTLIELMISITILAIMMLFLYKSYANLNLSNAILKDESSKIQKIQKIKKVIYLDFLLRLGKAIPIDKREKNEDFVTFQTSHSIHKRYHPYVAYIVKEEKLYRLESLHKIKDYELSRDGEYEIDCLGEVKSFRVYPSSDKESEAYLVHVDFKKEGVLLLKIKVLA